MNGIRLCLCGLVTAALFSAGANAQELCDPTAMYSMPPTDPNAGWLAGTSDVGQGYKRFEDYAAPGEIGAVWYWGLTLFYPWAACTEDPMDFEIGFWADNGSGQPDISAPVCLYYVSLSGIPTSYLYAGFQVYRFETPLSPTCSLAAGWMSVQGVTVQPAPDCWFLWCSTGENGAGNSWWYDGTTWGTELCDFSMCLYPGVGCPADVNGDGVVDVLDLLDVLAAWGAAGGPADINGDGIVDVLDLLELLAAWGPCYPMGACCTPDGLCTDTTEVDCIIAGGDWYEGEECATFQCPALPTGACCVGPDCVATNTEYECGLLDGNWYEGEDCANFVCPIIYCEAASEYCDDEYISNVVFGAISNPSACGFYQDFTALVNPMQIGVGQTITVTNAEYWVSDLTTVWVDWNSDGDFYDAGEEFQLGDPGGPIATGVITAPPGAYIGQTRMRIRIQYGGVPDPCGLMFYGEVEDYTVDVSP